MSIEQALADTTAAIRDLIAALSARPLPIDVNAAATTAPVRAAAAEEAAPAKKQRAQKDAPTAGTETVSTPATATAEPAAATPAPVEPEAPAPAPAASFDDCVPLFRRLGLEKGRDAVVALLGKYNAAKLSDIAANRMGEVFADLNAALAASAAAQPAEV